LIKARCLTVGLWLVAPFLAGLVLAWLVSPWWWLLVAFVVAGMRWEQWLAPPQVRALGYAERDEDLLIRKGILFQRLVVVPYGRMQFVDVTAGPLDRAFGLATVQLHTAATTTAANIQGLPPAEAGRLRDRLAARGEASLAGI
jgi:membrane protein YdbS with pleckstrin-like domain